MRENVKLGGPEVRSGGHVQRSSSNGMLVDLNDLKFVDTAEWSNKIW